MTPLAIVKHFDVLEDRRSGFDAAFVVAMMDQFSFQSMEKTLSDSIVPAITLFAHAGQNAVGEVNFPMALRSILTAAITVKNQAPGWLALPDRHSQGIIDQRGVDP